MIVFDLDVLRLTLDIEGVWIVGGSSTYDVTSMFVL